jgi:hypothetical protein
MGAFIGVTPKRCKSEQDTPGRRNDGTYDGRKERSRRVPYFKVAFTGRSDKGEVGKNFQATDSRASLGSVNDFPKTGYAEKQALRKAMTAGDTDSRRVENRVIPSTGTGFGNSRTARE